MRQQDLDERRGTLGHDQAGNGLVKGDLAGFVKKAHEKVASGNVDVVFEVTGG